MSKRSWIALGLALSLVACDSFDFGRVTGSPTPPAAAASAIARAPSAQNAQSAAPTVQAPSRLVLILGGELWFPPDAKAKTAGITEPDVLAGVRSVMEDASTSIASLATPLDGHALGTDHVPAAAELLSARIGVLDVGTVATTTPAALASGTLATLIKGASAVAGAGTTPEARARGARVAVPGGSVTVISAARATTAPATPAETSALTAAIQGAHSAGDVVVASLGGATPNGDAPSEADKALAQAAIGAGADAVVVHGGKGPLGVSFSSGRPVFHGLGRLVGPENPKDPWESRGFLAKVTLGKGAPLIVDLCPYIATNGKPALLAGPSRATQEGVFRRALARLSSSLGTVTISDPDAHSCFRVTESQ